MYTERQAIQDEIHEIRRETQVLRDRKADLLKRLREIDERDLKGPVSYDALNDLTEKLMQVIGDMSEIVPKVSAVEVMEHIAGKVDPEQIILEPENTIAAEVHKEAKQDKLHRARQPRMSQEKAASTVKEIILSSEGPAKLQDIEKEFIERTGRKYNNFSTVVYRAMERYPDIKRVSTGVYDIERKE